MGEEQGIKRGGQILAWLDSCATWKSIACLGAVHLLVLSLLLLSVMLADSRDSSEATGAVVFLVTQVANVLLMMLLAPLMLVAEPVGRVVGGWVSIPLFLCNSLVWGGLLTFLVRYRPSRLSEGDIRGR